MKTFFIQLILAHICLSNAKLFTEKNGTAQQQWPLAPRNNALWNEAMMPRNQKELSNPNGWINGTRLEEGNTFNFFSRPYSGPTLCCILCISYYGGTYCWEAE